MEASNKGEHRTVFYWHEQGCSSNYFLNLLKTGVNILCCNLTHLSDIPSACQLVHIAPNLGEQVLLETLPKGGSGVKRERHFLPLHQQTEHLWRAAAVLICVLINAYQQREGGVVSKRDLCFQFSFEQHKILIGGQKPWVGPFFSFLGQTLVF